MNTKEMNTKEMIESKGINTNERMHTKWHDQDMYAKTITQSR